MKNPSNWKQLCDDRLGDVSSDDVVHEKRFLQLTKNLDGSWALRGTLDKLTGETLSTALKAATPLPGPDDAAPPVNDATTPSVTTPPNP